MILVDELYCPNPGYSDAVFANDIKTILSFVGSLEGNEYAKHFPGFCQLREYAMVLTDHAIAEPACIPSRAAIMTRIYLKIRSSYLLSASSFRRKPEALLNNRRLVIQFFPAYFQTLDPGFRRDDESEKHVDLILR